MFFAIAGAPLLSGCSSRRTDEPVRQLPPCPEFPPDHLYTLDDLTRLAIHENAGLDVARYEAEAAQGLVDQVKSLWLPALRYDFAGILYDDDLSYTLKPFNTVPIDVPLTGNYNIVNSISMTQIISTFGKRTSGLKQAKMFAALKRLEVLRQQDAVAFDVSKFYHLVCLTNELDGIVEEALRRLRVFQQVADELNRRGSLRSSRLDYLQADYLIAQLEQARIALQSGRDQAYLALRQSVGIPRTQPLTLRSATLPPAITLHDVFEVSAALLRGFRDRPELQQVNLFTKIREQQVEFAKAAWRPNIAFLGTYTDVQSNTDAILGVVEGLILSLFVDVPIYNPARRGRLREALGLEYASKAFQEQVEELIALEIEVTAVDCKKALATIFKARQARNAAREQYLSTRQAFSRDLVPASEVATAIVLDMLARIQYQQALFNYHDAKARLKRVTADRESAYGY